MQHFLFVSIETTAPGNEHLKIDLNADASIRLVQITWALYNENKTLIANKNYIVRPQGFEIPDEASNRHKITTDVAQAMGNNPEKVLNELNQLIEDNTTIIAHNLAFLLQVLNAEFSNRNIKSKLKEVHSVCSAKNSTSLFPSTLVKNGYPTIEALYNKLFERDETHPESTENSVVLLSKCAWELLDRNLIQGKKQVEAHSSEENFKKAEEPKARVSKPSYDYRYASFGQRLIALIIDNIIILFSLIVISFFLRKILFNVGLLNDSMAFWGYTFFHFRFGLFGASWLYHAAMESSRHQATIGKRAFNLVVTNMNGERISFLQATGRHLGKMLSIIFFVGYIMAAFTDKRQGLHDMMAGTLVLERNPSYPNFN